MDVVPYLLKPGRRIALTHWALPARLRIILDDAVRAGVPSPMIRIPLISPVSARCDDPGDDLESIFELVDFRVVWTHSAEGSRRYGLAFATPDDERRYAEKMEGAEALAAAS